MSPGGVRAFPDPADVSIEWTDEERAICRAELLELLRRLHEDGGGVEVLLVRSRRRWWDD